ncbi:drug/metabolite transporter (DMT)-like permease [Pedobacter cryoconitis]|uniref:Drug/metabolite transporter (DMT)-like permease n=1 Tax=Pedobacter cryoconitis TaxID=188932 RepID=A0A7W8ZNK8_9SPHI|nr:EamA family transporter [Pedobacter cryoconitis]MBB5637153.1 drug/metabolite transporter (DMT)-like permease [Pedobacter cryoconitis]
MTNKNASPLLVYLAFAIVYIVWGSTYFFIQKALAGFPPFILGTIRFIIAGTLLMTWCRLKGEKIFDWKNIKYAAVSGILMLGAGNGMVIWVEQFIPSGLVAIMAASAAIWFVILDKSKWKENLSSKSTIAGLIIGFTGVILLFSEQVILALNTQQSNNQILGMVLVALAPVAWAGGSLYSKYHTAPDSSVSVNTAWQMLAASIIFIPGSFISDEYSKFHFSNVPADAWFSIIYLIIFGSIIAFSAYVWLLKVRPATQVSTYAYVNPVVALLLSICFTSEKVSWIQILGLVVILCSVLLINLVKYRKDKIPAGSTVL